MAHLPFDTPTADLELPETVRSWSENLILLEGVPFHYLVPDERILPAESIRFFQVDPIWIECLVDGAAFETDLDKGKASTDLHQAFVEQSQALLQDSLICILASTGQAPTNTTYWKVYTSTSIDPLYWREEDKRTIRIGALAKEIADQTKAQTFSAAEFALEMIEGAEKVRFCSIP